MTFAVVTAQQTMAVVMSQVYPFQNPVVVVTEGAQHLQDPNNAFAMRLAVVEDVLVSSIWLYDFGTTPVRR